MSELKKLELLLTQGKISRREFLAKISALGLMATLSSGLLTTPAGAAASTQEPKRGGVLKAGLQGGESTDSIDPATIQNLAMVGFCKAWGEYIIAFARDGSLEPRIAEEWGPSRGGKVWTFKIRRGIEFHNGKTVTASDVAMTLERHSDEKSKSGALGILRSIENISVNGDEAIVTLTDPNVDFPYLLTDYHLIVQPNGGKDDPTAGVSAGPYKVAFHEPGVRHGAERFKNYWQPENLGFADQVEVKVLNDMNARIAALKSGQVHLINSVDPKVVSFLKQSQDVIIHNSASPVHYAFLMHCNTAPFDNNDLRMALKLAVDRKDMVNKILQGFGSLGNDFPVNQTYPLFPDDIEQREFDPDRAAFHYRKSGHDGPILLRTSEAAFPGANDAAQLFQQSCAKANIKIKIQRSPSDGYWSEVWNVLPFSTCHWGGRPTQDMIYSAGYLSTAPWNDTRFHNKRFDQLLIATRGELDQDKRKQMYREMAVLVRDEGGSINPMFTDVIDAVRAEVGGYTPGKTQEMMDGFALSRCWLIT